MTENTNTKSQEINEIATALSKAQFAIDLVEKGKDGYGYKYATLGAVQLAVRQAFYDNGLSYTHLLTTSSVQCILMHKSGQWLQSEYPIDATISKGMNLNQAMGSSITYGRRYTLAAIAGIPQEDDDSLRSNYDKATNKIENGSKIIINHYNQCLSIKDVLKVDKKYSKEMSTTKDTDIDLYHDISLVRANVKSAIEVDVVDKQIDKISNMDDKERNEYLSSNAFLKIDDYLEKNNKAEHGRLMDYVEGL